MKQRSLCIIYIQIVSAIYNLYSNYEHYIIYIETVDTKYNL